ncbi:hypothetical protein JOF56_009959 [Kibdelosporangium banguiense]|uniref:Uncharacterized protein n=1 Tax=Kibdelosporangium banguiense TaxID=1365924 RepID=A0ABS4U026_9PSEU|nr:hypothetical protein [Kibdelosporangium banguiense]MBP2329574.1 hypothetical protein [Kibdelosporangium banguiense]
MEPRNDEETRFGTALAARASRWQRFGLAPDDTEVLAVLTPLVVMVDVGLPTAAGIVPEPTKLQVAYWTTGGEAALEGYWGNELVMDGFDANDDEVLVVRGLCGEPEQFAVWTADWLERQLARPVVRQEWRRGAAVVFQRWVLADTGDVLAQRGNRGLRRLVGPHRPDATILVRNSGG